MAITPATPAAPRGRSPKPKRELSPSPPITVKSTEGLKRIERVFPLVVTAVDLGWLPPGYVSPAIRLEALRAIADIGLGPWRRGVQIGNWRTTNTLDGAVTADPADELPIRCTIRDLIAKLPSPVEMAWVLGGVAGIPELKTFEQRVRWALAIWQGRPDPQGVFGLDDRLTARVYERAGISVSIIPGDLTAAAGTPAQERAIQATVERTAPWCSAAWLRTGIVASPLLLEPFVARWRAIPPLPNWQTYAQEPFTLTLTREQGLALQRLLANGPMAAPMRTELSEMLDEATEVLGLTFAANTLKPMTVDGLLKITGSVEGGLIEYLCRHEAKKRTSAFRVPSVVAPAAPQPVAKRTSRRRKS